MLHIKSVQCVVIHWNPIYAQSPSYLPCDSMDLYNGMDIWIHMRIPLSYWIVQIWLVRCNWPWINLFVLNRLNCILWFDNSFVFLAIKYDRKCDCVQIIDHFIQLMLHTQPILSWLLLGMCNSFHSFIPFDPNLPFNSIRKSNRFWITTYSFEKLVYPQYHSHQHWLRVHCKFSIMILRFR